MRLVANDRLPVAVDFASGAGIHVPVLGVVAEAKEITDAFCESRLAVGTVRAGPGVVMRRVATAGSACLWDGRECWPGLR